MSDFGKGLWAVITFFILIVGVASLSNNGSALPVIFLSIAVIVLLLPFALLGTLLTLVRRRRKINHR